MLQDYYYFFFTCLQQAYGCGGGGGGGGDTTLLCRLLANLKIFQQKKFHSDNVINNLLHSLILVLN